MLLVGLTFLYGSLAEDFPLLEDDGLFVLASFYAGTAHSPGYPLFVLLSQPFLLLPFGTVAFKVHLVDCFLAAMSCTTVFLLLRRFMKVSPLPALSSALVLGFSSLFFQQALIAEAYMLNVLLLLLTIWCLLSAQDRPLKRWLFLAAFFYGLALSNHWPLTVLVTPALLVLAAPLLRLVSRLPLVLLGIIAGLLPYAWMYLSSADDKFSHVGAFPSAIEFFDFVRRDVFSDIDRNKQVTGGDKILFLDAYLREATGQFSLVALPFIAIGFVLQWQRLALHIALGLSLFTLLPLALVVLIDFEFERSELAAMLAYPLPLWVVASFWLAMGLETLNKASMNWPGRQWLVSGVCLIIVGSVVFSHRQIPAENQSDWSEAIARRVLDDLPQDSVLFVMGNWSMAQVAYLRLVQGVRPDVTLYSEYGSFLPDRLYPYHLDEAQKQSQLLSYVGEAGRPLYSLQPLNLPDIKLANPFANDFPGLMVKKTQGVWNKLYQREILIWHIQGLANQTAQPYESLAANLMVAGRLLNRGEIEVGLVADLLAACDEEIGDADRFDLADFALQKGRLMLAVGEPALARQYFELSVSYLPVSRNEAHAELLSLGYPLVK
jgi:4-amino-4-deoxy-L-arabinose transferase-like glycosyltransferase